MTIPAISSASFTEFGFASSSRHNASEIHEFAGGRVCDGRFDQQLAKR
jgi:hypothetical protein